MKSNNDGQFISCILVSEEIMKTIANSWRYLVIPPLTQAPYYGRIHLMMDKKNLKEKNSLPCPYKINNKIRNNCRKWLDNPSVERGRIGDAYYIISSDHVPSC